jgi:hypothetical protein
MLHRTAFGVLLLLSACASGRDPIRGSDTPAAAAEGPVKAGGPFVIGSCYALDVWPVDPGVHPPHPACTNPQSGFREPGERIALFYSWALVEAAAAYDMAERAACGTSGCGTPGRTVRVHLVLSDRLANVWVEGTNAGSGPIDVFLNTAMIQFIEGASRAFLGDALAERMRVSTDNGFLGWLRMVGSMSGAPCDTTITIPGLDLPQQAESPEDSLARSSRLLVLGIVMGHELAHFTDGRRCGVPEHLRHQNERLVIEQACDSISIARLTDPRLQQATIIAVPVLVALHHYDRWLAPSYSREVPFDERFPARNWAYRGELLLRNWYRTCQSNDAMPMCEGRQQIGELLADLLRRAPPSGCSVSHPLAVGLRRRDRDWDG